MSQKCLCNLFEWGRMLNSACFHYQKKINMQTDPKLKKAMIRTRKDKIKELGNLWMD